MKLLSIFLFPAALFCSPKGATISHGHAQVIHRGSETQIETSHHTVINWDSFSVASGETTRFIQPHCDATVVNRVSIGVSQIDGTLTGNGRIYLLNPNGILVGKSGVISCAAFAASTLDFDTDACFKGESLLFKGESKEKIINCGKIEALCGDVLLLGRFVMNEGAIVAKEGAVRSAAANEILLKPQGVERLFISPKREESVFLENSGVIEATRAELKADGNVYRLAMNQTGIIEATGICTRNGQIILSAGDGKIVDSEPLLSESRLIQVLDGEKTFIGKDFEENDLTEQKAYHARATRKEAGFIPKPLHIPSQTEQWASAYPDKLKGEAFTPFYKSGIFPLIPNVSNRIFAEMFQKLHTYDELLVCCKCFLFGYDQACYDQLFHPKGMVSSFDLFSEEQKYVLRQRYRNYELKYVESF